MYYLQKILIQLYPKIQDVILHYEKIQFFVI